MLQPLGRHEQVEQRRQAGAAGRGAARAASGTICGMDTTIPPRPDGAARLLVIGDSHGHAGMLSRACMLAAELEAGEIWSVGDFGVWPGRAGRGFLDSVEYDAAQAGVMVRVVPGNHDDYDQIDAALAETDDGWAHLRPHIAVARRGHVHRIHSTRIMCLSGAASIDGPGGLWGPWRGVGDGWWPQEVITDAEAGQACDNIDAAGGGVELMICHDLPDSAGVVGQADFLLGEQVRGRIRRVAEHGRVPLLVAGHWHRHIDRMVSGRREVVLSADVNPEQIQWAVIDIADYDPAPTLHLPAAWNARLTLS